MHRRFRFATGTSIALTIFAAPLLAGGEKLTDPREILKRADAAMKAVKTVSYEAKYTSEGWVKPFVADVEGKVVLGPDGEY